MEFHLDGRRLTHEDGLDGVSAPPHEVAVKVLATRSATPHSYTAVKGIATRTEALYRSSRHVGSGVGARVASPSSSVSSRMRTSIESSTWKAAEDERKASGRPVEGQWKASGRWA